MGRPQQTLFLLLFVAGLCQCRVQAGPRDGPASDGDATDGPEVASDAPDEVDSRDSASIQICDLLLQDCPDRKACYPDSTFSGATRCVLPGSGGPLSPCLLHEECDTGEICIDVYRDGFTVCTAICDPNPTPDAATPAGFNDCQRGAPCQRLTNYRAGTCMP